MMLGRAGDGAMIVYPSNLSFDGALPEWEGSKGSWIHTNSSASCEQ